MKTAERVEILKLERQLKLNRKSIDIELEIIDKSVLMTAISIPNGQSFRANRCMRSCLSLFSLTFVVILIGVHPIA